jgi:long-chain acyl-CoA synthetase
LVDALTQNASAGDGPGRNLRPAQKFAGWSSVLREDPLDEAALRIVKPRPVVDRMIYVLTRMIKLIWQLRSRIEVEGIQNVPSKGAYLLCSNHQSFLDPAMLLAVLPLRALLRLFAVGTSEIFGSGFMLMVARIMRVVVVDPDANLIPAMRAGAYGLRHGLGLILYPEGERSIDGTPKVFKKGAAILSIHLQVPIVPVAVDGLYESWPRGRSFQRLAPIKMKIGKPLKPSPEVEASEEAYAKLTAELKARVVEMWDELRGTKV